MLTLRDVFLAVLCVAGGMFSLGLGVVGFIIMTIVVAVITYDDMVDTDDNPVLFDLRDLFRKRT